MPANNGAAGHRPTCSLQNFSFMIVQEAAEKKLPKKRQSDNNSIVNATKH